MPVLILLIALAQQPINPIPAPKPGSPPGQWTPLSGTHGLRYRWSLPMSNSCSLEIEDPDGSGPVSLQLSVRLYATRRAPAVPSNPDSPIHVEPTRIRPREEERTVSMQLFRMGFENRTIHDCYGIVYVRAVKVGDSLAPTTPADSSSHPENPH